LVKKNNLLSTLFSINQISSKIKQGDVSPVDLVDVCLYRIHKLNSFFNSFITVIDQDQIYRQAEAAEIEIKNGNYLGPLHGIPFSIKDMFFAKGVKFTAGSKIFKNYIPNMDSTAVKQMKKSGAILIGTNNLNEFASGITGKNPFYGDSKNPWNQKRMSGGSSGGSAVAVATGMALVSLGTDTGGSIRVPAALCGVVGLKPSYDLINKNDIFPLTPSFDHIGWITKNVLDSYIVLQCLSKKNIFKRKTDNKNKNKNKGYFKVPNPYKFAKRKITLGIPNNYFLDYLPVAIEYLFSNFIKNLLSSSNSINIEYFNLKKTEQYYKSWKDVRLAEASNIHQSLFDIRKSDYSNEVKYMLIEGTKVSAIDYIKAIHTIKEIKDEFVFLLHHKVNAIVVPTTIISAPKLNEDSIYVSNDVSINVREALLRNTIIFNSIGLPAVSVPLGFTKKEKLPVGLQIIGPPYGDEILLSIAYYFECINNNSFDFVPPIAIK